MQIELSFVNTREDTNGSMVDVGLYGGKVSACNYPNKGERWDPRPGSLYTRISSSLVYFVAKMCSQKDDLEVFLAYVRCDLWLENERTASSGNSLNQWFQFYDYTAYMF